MLAMVTKVPQPSSLERASEEKAPPCILQQIARQTPATIIREGIISFNESDLSIVSGTTKENGWFIHPLKDATRSEGCPLVFR